MSGKQSLDADGEYRQLQQDMNTLVDRLKQSTLSPKSATLRNSKSGSPEKPGDEDLGTNGTAKDRKTFVPEERFTENVETLWDIFGNRKKKKRRRKHKGDSNGESDRDLTQKGRESKDHIELINALEQGNERLRSEQRASQKVSINPFGFVDLNDSGVDQIEVQRMTAPYPATHGEPRMSKPRNTGPLPEAIYRESDPVIVNHLQLNDKNPTYTKKASFIGGIGEFNSRFEKRDSSSEEPQARQYSAPPANADMHSSSRPIAITDPMLKHITKQLGEKLGIEQNDHLSSFSERRSSAPAAFRAWKGPNVESVHESSLSRPSMYESSSSRPSVPDPSLSRPSIYESSSFRPSVHDSSPSRPAIHQSSPSRPSVHVSSPSRPSMHESSISRSNTRENSLSSSHARMSTTNGMNHDHIQNDVVELRELLQQRDREKADYINMINCLQEENKRHLDARNRSNRSSIHSNGSAASTQQVSKLQSQCRSLENALQSVQQELADKQATTGCLKDKMTKMNDTIILLKQENDTKQRELTEHSQVRDELHQDIAHLRECLQKKQMEKADKLGMINMLQEENRKLSEDRSRQIDQLKAENHLLSQAERRTADLFESERQNLNEMIESMRLDHETKKQKMKQLVAFVDQQNRQISGLKEVVAQKEKDARDGLEMIYRLQDEINRLQKVKQEDSSEVRTQLRQKTEECRALEGSLCALGRQKANILNVVQDAKEEILNLRKEREDGVQQICKMGQEIQQMSQQLNTLNRIPVNGEPVRKRGKTKRGSRPWIEVARERPGSPDGSECCNEQRSDIEDRIDRTLTLRLHIPPHEGECQSKKQCCGEAKETMQKPRFSSPRTSQSLRSWMPVNDPC